MDVEEGSAILHTEDEVDVGGWGSVRDWAGDAGSLGWAGN